MGPAPGLGSWVRRDGAGPWLLLLALYKAGDWFATAMLRPYLIDAGYALGDLGGLLGTLGFTAGLAGALLGGALVHVLGRGRALVWFGAAQAAAIAAYAWPALDAPPAALYAICALEHLVSGMATAALFTAMMDACRPGCEATDYTVQACVVVIATGAASAVSGFSAERVLYPAHFALGGAVSAATVAYAAWYVSRAGSYVRAETR